jgi:hypothetical protein
MGGACRVKASEGADQQNRPCPNGQQQNRSGQISSIHVRNSTDAWRRAVFNITGPRAGSSAKSVFAVDSSGQRQHNLQSEIMA